MRLGVSSRKGRHLPREGKLGVIAGTMLASLTSCALRGEAAVMLMLACIGCTAPSRPG